MKNQFSRLFLLLPVLLAAACSENDSSKGYAGADLSAFSGSYKVVSFFDGQTGTTRDIPESYYSIYRDGVFRSFEKVEDAEAETPVFKLIYDATIFEKPDGYYVDQYNRIYKAELAYNNDLKLEIRLPYSVSGTLYTDIIVLERIGFDPGNYIVADGIFVL